MFVCKLNGQYLGYSSSRHPGYHLTPNVSQACRASSLTSLLETVDDATGSIEIDRSKITVVLIEEEKAYDLRLTSEMSF